ncbi:MAG: cytochrome c, class I [Exilibacterium sp.]
MISKLVSRVAAGLLLLANNPLSAGEWTINEPRAKFHYQMLCQGCHTDDGRGFNSVPMLKGYVGNFLKIEEGRSYLVRVPGSANADLNDDYLAELLNWMILEFGQGSEPESWKLYTGSEISAYRQQPLLEVIDYRKHLVQQIEILSADRSGQGIRWLGGREVGWRCVRSAPCMWRR